MSADGKGWLTGLRSEDQPRLTLSRIIHDLRRLRLHGLTGGSRDQNPQPSPEGIRIAVFYTGGLRRDPRATPGLSRPATAPPELRRAMATIDRAMGNHTHNAFLGIAV